MRTATALIVDDQRNALESLVRALKNTIPEIHFHLATSAVRAEEIAREYRPAIAVIDLSLNPIEGVESGYNLLRALLENDGTCRVIVLTGNSGSEFGVRALSLGAAHFIAKPADIGHLSVLIRDSFTQANLRRTVKKLESERSAELHKAVIGQSAGANKLREEICYAAATSLAVFIRGETGTGKGLCAEWIHRLSPRRGKPFIRYQPLFGSADITSSDLFGHRRGSFTGAAEERRGLLEDASGGTFFLDEVDELPRETQVMLLGALQDKKFRSLGGNQEKQIDIRIVSASNSIIEERIDAGTFRRDLFHRIAHHQISIPPLWERRDDIALLAVHSIDEMRNGGILPPMTLADTAIDKLKSYHWPGNIRELQSTVEMAAWRANHRSARVIEERDLIINVERILSSQEPQTLRERVYRYEEKIVDSTLREHNGSYSATARALGIDRGTVKRINARSGTTPNGHR